MSMEGKAAVLREVSSWAERSGAVDLYGLNCGILRFAQDDNYLRDGGGRLFPMVS